ncbi:MAG: endonuclease, partial [Chitinophagales bacterium]
MKKFYLFFAFIFLMNASIFAQAEPANQPTGFNSSSLRAYQVRVFYQTAGNGVRYLVLRDTSPITDVPTDNVAYTLGNSLGDAKVVGLNTNTSNTMRGLNANTTYYFAVFAYNESGGNQNYKTDNPLTGEITTLGLEPDNYYVGLDAESNGFIDDLSDVLSAHSHQLYGNFDETVIVNIHEKDTMGETGILCEYSNELQTYTGTFNFTDDNYTREHMLPRSWMPSDAETSDIEGADYHNLALVRDFVNTERLNYPMGEVTNPNWTYEEASGN